MGKPEGPLRIALIETDTPVTAICEKYGSYGGVYTSLLHKAADASEIPRSRILLTGWDVVDIAHEGQVEDCGGIYGWKRTKGYPDLEQIDAILLTGSKYNSFDNDEWILRLVEFTKRALEHPRVKVLGVCYGHQIIGRALGAKVMRHEQGTWEVSVCEVQQTQKGREIFGGKDVLKIMQMHRDIVRDYPQGVEELGSSDPCKVQAMYKEKKLITVQGHPEFDAEMETLILQRRKDQGIFDDDLFDDAMNRINRPHDGVLVAQAFLKMLTE